MRPKEVRVLMAATRFQHSRDACSVAQQLGGQFLDSDETLRRLLAEPAEYQARDSHIDIAVWGQGVLAR